MHSSSHLPRPGLTPRLSPAAKPSGGWRETRLLTLGAVPLLVLLNWHAFHAYFLAEAFVYIGSYRQAHDSFWGAVLSPHGHFFFRPVLWALNLPWNLWLPPQPTLYHLRNLAAVVLTLVLLHRVLLRLVPSASARCLAIAIFTVSKVHYTTIGYVAALSTPLFLGLTLASVLFFLRFLQQGKRLDHGLTLLFVGLTIFSKDYGAAVVLVLLVLALWSRSREGVDTSRMKGKRLVLGWLAPVAGLVLAYLSLRWTLVGPFPRSGPYAPEISLHLTLRKTALAASTLANLSLFEKHGLSGGRGITGWLVPPEPDISARMAEASLLVPFLVLFVRTAAAASSTGLLAVPLVWAAAYFAPTLLTRNEQILYVNDVVAAFSLFAGLGAARLSNRWRGLWWAAVTVLALNTVASRSGVLYTWEVEASNTSTVAPFVERHRSTDLSVLIVVANDPSYWAFVLTADDLGPMLPELLGKKDLAVYVTGAKSVDRTRGRSPDPHLAYLDADRCFREIVGPKAPDMAPLSSQTPENRLILTLLHPAFTRAGEAFHVQADNAAALAVTCEDATAQTTIVFGGRSLPTVYGGPNLLSARVPDDLYARPGPVPVHLQDPRRRSNTLSFTVLEGEGGPAPGPLRLLSLDPSSARRGQVFNVQPDGSAALAVACENATPDTVIVFGGKALTTVYGSASRLTAEVPKALYERSGPLPVHLRQGDVESNRRFFRVLP